MIEAGPFTVCAPDGVQLAAIAVGPKRARPIVLIHGSMQSAASWRQQTHGGLGRAFRVIAYDLRGHGDSDKPFDPIYYSEGRRFADELQATLQAAQIERPVIVGWSYGARVALDYVERFGEQGIAGLVLVGAAPIQTVRGAGPIESLGAQRDAVDAAERVRGAHAFLDACVAQPLEREVRDSMTAFNLKPPPVVRRAMMLRRADYGPVLERIARPVLVIHGLADRIVPVACAHDTVRRVKHARLVLYENVGHMPFWEAPERFDRDVAAFTLGCA